MVRASTVLGRRVWPQYICYRAPSTQVVSMCGHEGFPSLGLSAGSQEHLSTCVIPEPFHLPFQLLSAHPPESPVAPAVILLKPAVQFLLQCLKCLHLSPCRPGSGYLLAHSQSQFAWEKEGTVMIALQDFGVLPGDHVGFPMAESQMASEPLKNKTPQEANTCWEHHPGENSHPHLAAITETNEKIGLGKSILSQVRGRFTDLLCIVLAQSICLWLKGTGRLLKNFGELPSLHK